MTIDRTGGSGAWPEAVRAHGFVFLSGRTAAQPPELDPPPAPGSRFTSSIERETASQIWATYREVELALERAGSSLARIVLMNGWYADFRDWPVMDRLRSAYFSDSALPVSTGFASTWLPRGGARVAYEVIAVTDARDRQVVGSPVQVGSYAAGSKVGDLVFLAGEVPADLERGIAIRQPSDLLEHEDEVLTGVFGLDGWEGRMRAQTWAVYERIRKTLSDSGSGLDRIAKQNVYLRDLRDLPAFERMSQRILGDTRPATTFVKVEQYGHQSFDLEVEVTAIAAPAKTRVLAADQPEDYPEAVVAPPFAFLSGLVGRADSMPDDAPASAQAARIYDEAERILAKLGLDRAALVRQVIYLTQLGDLAAVEAVARERTNGAEPATTFVGVKSIVPSGSAIQIDFTAAT